MELFCGHFSVEWAAQQDFYLRQQNLRSHTRTGRTWIIRLLRFLWDWQHEIWMARNADIHGHDVATRAMMKRQILKRRLREFHLLRDQVCQADRDVFLVDDVDDLEDFAQRHSPTYLQDWINMHGHRIVSSVRRAEELSIANTPTLYTMWNQQPPAPTRNRSRVPESRGRTIHDRPRAMKLLSRLARGTNRIARYFTRSKPATAS